MTKYRKKQGPIEGDVEVITFDELVAHGIAAGAAVHDGMPWSFTYNGHPVTHENDDCYLISTPGGTLRFGRRRVLITYPNGKMRACPAEEFAENYEAVDPNAAYEVVDPNQAEIARLRSYLSRQTCYLIAHIDAKTMQVTGVGTYSSPPWLLTRQLGPGRPIMGVVVEASAETYAEALEQVEESYPVYEPDLAARFPLPSRDDDDEGGTLVAATGISGTLVT